MFSTQQIENTEIAVADTDVAINFQDNHIWGVQVPLEPKTYLPAGSPRQIEQMDSQVDDERRRGLKNEIARLRLLADEFKNSPKFNVRLGCLEALIEDNQIAEDRLRHAAKLSDDGYYQEQLAEFYVRKHRIEDARNIFQSQYDRGQPSITTCLRLAEFAVRDNDMELAMQYVNKALGIDFINWKVHLFAGTLYLMMPTEFNYARLALRHFKLAREEQPRNPLVAFNSGITYLVLKQEKRAINAFKSACILDPGDTKLLAAYAKLAQENPKHQEIALAYIEQYMDTLGPDSTMLAYMVELARKNETIKAYLPLIENMAAELNDSFSLNNVGVALSVLNKKENDRRAISYFKKAYLKSAEESGRSSSKVALANLVDQLCRIGNRDEALKLATEFMDENKLDDVTVDDDAQRIVAAFIDLNFELGDTKVALHTAETVLSIPQAHDHLVQDACCSLFLWYSGGPDSDFEKALGFAENAYQSVQKLDSNSNEHNERLNTVVNNLSFIYAELDRLQEADQLINSKDLSGMGVSWATKGLIFLKSGNLLTGRKLYQKAMKMTVEPEFRSLISNKMNLEVCKCHFRSGRVSNKIKKILKGIAGDNAKSRYSWRSVRIKSEARELLEKISLDEQMIEYPK